MQKTSTFGDSICRRFSVSINKFKEKEKMKKSITIVFIVISVIITMFAMQLNTTAATDATIENNGIKYEVPIGSTISCDCFFTVPKTIVNGQFDLEYPSNLKVESISVPKYIKNYMPNDVKSKHTIKMNFTDYGGGVDFTSKKLLMNVSFKVVESGEGKLNLSVECVSYIDANEIKVIKEDYETDVELQISEPIETAQDTSEEIIPTSSSEEKETVAPTEEPTEYNEPTIEGSIAIKNNPVKVTVKNKTVKASTLKKRNITIKPFKIKNKKTPVTFKKLKKGTSKKVYKKVKVKRSTGAITLKKGKYAKKNYTIKVRIKAEPTENYHYKQIDKKIKVKVK